ncbi:MAG TPA: PH domain-containing protein, partial [Acidimicrobiales bacterium]|nr:PH domain-containing protein [Acidimicrobiales bacterium]
TAQVSPGAAATAAGVLGAYILGLATASWRRMSIQYHFEATEAPEGIRIRRGLLETVTETIPYARVQAVRQIEPLLWRPLGWCRLEVDIAGATVRTERGEGSSVARKALLPVGGLDEARALVARLMGDGTALGTKPPHRARWKAPLSFHFLTAGHDTAHAVCVTGRLRKETAWVPLDKSQSIRMVQGPIQRRFGLASVHVDVAGRRVRAEFRDRDLAEADHLVHELSDLSRAARRHPFVAPAAQPRPAPAPAPDGWYRDPSGAHDWRYWRDGRWTEHVSTAGTVTADQGTPS